MHIADAIYPGDIVLMRKPHPCGGTEWEVTRVGADIGMVCLTCQRRVMLSRRDFTRQVKKFVRRSPQAQTDGGPIGGGLIDAASTKAGIPGAEK